MSETIYTHVLDSLQGRELSSQLEHPPVLTCEQADQYTPEPEAGLKTILLRTKKTKRNILCVLSGHALLDSMAKKELVMSLLDCDPGSVPPLVPLERVIIHIDQDLLQYETWYFNPGKNTVTFGVKQTDILEILKGRGAEISDISKK